MCLAEILCMAGFATYPALLPRLQAEWSLSGGEAGLIGGILFLGYILAVPFLTSLTDRIDARIVYLGATLAAASGSVAFALIADGLWGALVAQLLFGAGFAGIYMPGLKALSDRIDERLQSRATALYTSLSGLGLAASFALAGWISAHGDWRWAFALAALGPLAAGLLVLVGMAPRAPSAAARRVGLVESFREVFRNKQAMGYIAGYTAHCWELYGVRAWMVAFLAFSSSAAGIAGFDATGAAALVALGGIVSSIGCNELAKRFGRASLVTFIMAATTVIGVCTGFSWRLPFAACLGLVALHYGAVMADSGALTAGTVAAARPERRGATLAVHSTLGFTAGLVAPTAFGLVLDLAGGAASGWAWAVAFGVLAAPGVAAIVALRVLAARSQPEIVGSRAGLAVS